MSTQLACPRCNVYLTPAPAGPHQMHGCTQCGGVWLCSQGTQQLGQALDRALQQTSSQFAQHARAQADQTQRIYCPACRKALEHGEVSSQRVVLDWCDEHGTWFDPGELQRVAQAVAVSKAYGGQQQVQQQAQHAGPGGLPVAAAVGAGVVGAAAIGGAAVAAQDPSLQQQVNQYVSSNSEAIATGAEVATDVALEMGGAEAVVDGAGIVAEAAPGILEGVFGLLGGILEGL